MLFDFLDPAECCASRFTPGPAFTVASTRRSTRSHWWNLGNSSTFFPVGLLLLSRISSSWTKFSRSPIHASGARKRRLHDISRKKPDAQRHNINSGVSRMKKPPRTFDWSVYVCSLGRRVAVRFVASHDVYRVAELRATNLDRCACRARLACRRRRPLRGSCCCGTPQDP